LFCIRAQQRRPFHDGLVRRFHGEGAPTKAPTREEGESEAADRVCEKIVGEERTHLPLCSWHYIGKRQFTSDPLVGVGFTCQSNALVGPFIGDLAHMNMVCPNIRLLASELYPLSLSLLTQCDPLPPLPGSIPPSLPSPWSRPPIWSTKPPRHVVDARRGDPLGVDALALTTPTPALAIGVLT
jgi:hypothetical protein